MEALAKALRNAYGVDVHIVTAGVSLPCAPAELFAETQRRDLEIDFAINNPGAEGRPTA